MSTRTDLLVLVAYTVGEETRQESWIERRGRRNRKKASFDISLPAQHLVYYSVQHVC